MASSSGTPPAPDSDSGSKRPSTPLNRNAPAFVPPQKAKSASQLPNLPPHQPRMRGRTLSTSSSASIEEELGDASSQPSPCVWVGNVCDSVSDKALGEAFEKFGPIHSLSVFRESACAFVTFEDAQSAVNSTALEGTQLGKLRLTLNVGRASRHLWVGNFDPERVSEHVLLERFGEFGVIESIRVLKDNGCAFVNFEEEKEAIQAAREMDGALVEGSKLRVNFQWVRRTQRKVSSRAHYRHSGKPVVHAPPSPSTMVPLTMPHSPRLPSRQLFVGGVDHTVTDDQLMFLFAHFGIVEAIKRFPSRSYVFIVYVYLPDAIWCCQQLSMYPPILNNRVLRVNFGKQPVVDPMTGRLHLSLSQESLASSHAPSPMATPVTGNSACSDARSARSRGGHPRFLPGSKAKSFDYDELRDNHHQE